MTTRRAAFRRTATLLAAVAVSTATTIAVSPEANAAGAGTVYCGNGKAVKGVYINAGNKSGWAWIGKVDGQANYVNWYRGEISKNSWYSVNVGCGSWNPTFRSDYTNVHSGDFVCVPKVAKTGSLTNKCWDS